jgi:hypothetical protein
MSWPTVRIEVCSGVDFPLIMSKFSYRFFEVSGVAFLSLVISRYKVEVMEEAKFAGETFEEKRARVTNWYNGISLT